MKDRFTGPILKRRRQAEEGSTTDQHLLDSRGSSESLPKLAAVVSAAEVMSMIDAVRSVYVADALSCGSRRLRAIICWPLARVTAARASSTVSLLRSARRMASSSDTLRTDGVCAASGAAISVTRIPILVERMCTCLATATPGSGDALPGTVRQRRRAETHGAHEGFDVSSRSLIG